MIERLDPIAVLEGDDKPGKLAVNLRAGQTVVLQPAEGAAIYIVMESKHGNGARITIRAQRSVKILTPGA